MVLSVELSERIATVSCRYIGTPFDWENFNCVHFVREVYREVGIVVPLLARHAPPPRDFHLSVDEYNQMPLGHMVFFKRKARITSRYWSHVALIAGPTSLIHCTRHVGNGVIVSSKSDFMEVYDLAVLSQ